MVRLAVATAIVATVGFASTQDAVARAVPATPAAASTTAAASSAFDAGAWGDSAGDINPKILSLALEAAASAVQRGSVRAPSTLSVIDFSRPSTSRRMWVYDLRSHALLFEDFVSHGRGSGRTLATKFSNQPGSYESSLGLFRTGDAYLGKNGYSLRLDGLEPGINDRARERAIVMHGAPYVNPTAAQVNGYLGRSEGCPAVRPEIARAIIDAVKGGGLLFAYYPDPQWLTTSTFLN